MKNIKAILTILVLVAAGFLTWKVLPPFVANYNLRSDTDNMVLQYTYAQGATAEAIRNDVIAKAKEHDITLTEDNVNVNKTQVGVSVDIHYSVPVQIPGRVIDLKFEFTSGNKMITAK